MDSREFLDAIKAHTGLDSHYKIHCLFASLGLPVHQVSLSKWHNRKQCPSLAKAAQIAKAVGLQITITPKQQSNEQDFNCRGY